MEVGDGCYRKIDVVSPPGGYGVSFEACMAVPLKEREERLPHLIDGMRFEDRIADEVIRHTWSVAAEFLFGVAGPESRPAALADLPLKPLGSEIIERIFFLEH
jgi:hypothetical protein